MLGPNTEAPADPSPRPHGNIAMRPDPPDAPDLVPLLLVLGSRKGRRTLYFFHEIANGTRLLAHRSRLLRSRSLAHREKIAEFRTKIVKF